MSRMILKIVSYIGLILTLIPSFLVFSKVIELDTNKYLMLFGTLLWFGCAPFWINKTKKAD
ncbi:MAG: hypothetical protein P8Y99_14420 [Calditrichaceae bacterium]